MATGPLRDACEPVRSRQQHRQALRPSRPQEGSQITQVPFEALVLEEFQRTERLVLDADRHIAFHGGVLHLKKPRRVPSDSPIRFTEPFCIHETIQSPYSIDRLRELPGHQRPFPPHPGQLIGDLIGFEFGQPPNRMCPDELLCSQRIPAHRCGLDSLREKNGSVAVTETPFPVDATVWRHMPPLCACKSKRGCMLPQQVLHGQAGSGSIQQVCTTIYHSRSICTSIRYT